jgi:hypothetical protein
MNLKSEDVRNEQTDAYAYLVSYCNTVCRYYYLFVLIALFKLPLLKIFYSYCNMVKN